MASFRHVLVLLVSTALPAVHSTSRDDAYYEDPTEHPLPEGHMSRDAVREHLSVSRGQSSKSGEEEFRIEWRFAEPQQDCNSSCAALALQCSDAALATVNTTAAFEAVVASVPGAPACGAHFQAVPGSQIDHNTFAPFDCAGAGCCVGLRTSFALPAPPPLCSTVPVGVETTNYRRYCPCIVPCIQPCEYCNRLCGPEGLGHGALGSLGCFKRCSRRFDDIRAVLDGYCAAGGACRGDEPAATTAVLQSEGGGGAAEEAASLLQHHVVGPSASPSLGEDAAPAAETAAGCRRPCDYCDELCGHGLGLRSGQRVVCKKRCVEQFSYLQEKLFDNYCFHGACGHPLLSDGQQPAGSGDDDQASLLQHGARPEMDPAADSELDEL